MVGKKVLIVEDDSLFANALAGAVKKAGYESQICSSPEEATKALDRESFKVVFIDCLLPQTPGLDFAKAIRKNFDAKILPIVMMSGIFTDKQMMKDMIQEISALDFLKKPFEINEVLRFLEKESTVQNDESLAGSIFSLSDRVGANPAQMNQILQGIKRIHGYEIPLLITSAIVNSYSGIMQLMSEKGEKTKVIINKGNIVAVESPDVQSYLGKLLVENGWVLASDLEVALNKSSEKKLGQRLIAENFISPHAVFEVMEKQMAMRLSKIIQDQNYVVHFEDKNIELEGASIEAEEFYILLDEWIGTRVSGDWLNSQFAILKDYTVRLGPSHDTGRVEYSVKSIGAVKDVITNIESIGILSSLQVSYQNKLSEFHRAFYYMLCLRFVLFTAKVVTMSEPERIARLQKIWSQIKDLTLIDAFPILGGNREMTLKEIRELYSEVLQKNIGEIPKSGDNPVLLSVYESLRKRVAEIFELFQDPQKLSKYEHELAGGAVTKRSQAQAKADEAKKFLSMRQFASAIVLINKASELFPNLDQLILLNAWAKIGLLVNSKNKEKDIAEIDQLLSRVPNEEKTNPLGNFVHGLIAKAKGETALARSLFEAVLAVDKNMIEARRELNTIPVEVKKTVDLLHGDLGQVIGNLFKK